MSALIVPLLYPDLAELLNFSDPDFRITLALPTTRKAARPVNTRLGMRLRTLKRDHPAGACGRRRQRAQKSPQEGAVLFCVFCDSNYNAMIPRFNPTVTAWVRPLAPSLERMLFT